MESLRQPESPKAPPTPNAEGKEGTPKKQKQCNCKHSRCLKLYCECFASGIDCDGCNCLNCHNNIANEPARRGAMESLLERYPYAFRPKIAQSLHGRRDNVTAPAVAPAPTPVVVFPPPQQQHVLGHMQPESPKAPPRPNDEGKEGTPKKQKQCNCKPSRCLKLYCECFASGVYYDGCNCVNCHNNVDNEPARRDAIESILERNPQAFRPFITNSPHGECDNREETGEVAAKHNKGCHCKKSGCLKRSCESFHANIHCSENCKCMDCKNFEGSPEREAIFLDPIHDVTSFQESASAAAITESVGSSSYGEPLVGRKRRPE